MRIKVECRQDERLIKAHRVNPTNFLVELKRRNVYRAAVAYGVAAWFLTQLTTQVFPFFEIPNSAVRFVVIALAVGFPIAMLLAWIYEFTPEGIVRTEDLDPVHARSVQRATGRILDFIIIGVLLLVIAMLIVGRLPFYRQTGESISQKSIAVLPFENLSEDKANAYFAEGIQDEILTRLSKIADLKVISRTSTQHYKSTPENVPEIARQLGVAHILEGRVQKSGDVVRVNVQLIKAANDSHLWADTFDRKLTDLLSVESEVAKAIAEQLRVHLTGREEQVIAAKPTDNPDAYDAYLRGLAYNVKTAYTPANALGAQKYLREAVRLDPKFALGWALLSIADARGYITQSLQPTVALCEETRHAAETALALQPDLGEALLATGNYYYACLKDYDTAVRYFEQARQFLPNSSQISVLLASVARRRGHWDQSMAYFQEAERLDPRNVNLLGQYAQCCIELRRFPEALRKFDQVLDIMPGDVDTLAAKAAIAPAEGDLPRASGPLAAFKFIEQAMAAIPIEKDAVAGPIPIEILARVAAQMGEPDRGIAALQKLLAIPYDGALAQNVPLTPALLRLDPMFDLLRNDPRFHVLASGAAK